MAVPKLVNGGFEEPSIPHAEIRQIPYAGVPGWMTTAADHLIEIWSAGHEDVPGQGIPADEGTQFAELNANEVSTLYQDLPTVPGSTMLWRLSHRGRSGEDTMALDIGPPPPGRTLEQRLCVDAKAWGHYHGIYVVPDGQTVTRFAFRSVAAAGGNQAIGNFLDGIFFGEPGVVLTPATNDVSLAKGAAQSETVMVTIPKSTVPGSAQKVTLVASGDIAQFVQKIEPAGGHGPVPRDQDQKLKFDVSWLGALSGSTADLVYRGFLDVVVDGQIEGAKTVRVTVPAALPKPVLPDSLPPIFPEEGKILPRPAIPSGQQWMIIHHVSGTYLETDDYAPSYGERVQIWYLDPPQSTKGLLGHLWVLDAKGDGYTIHTQDTNASWNPPEHLYLEAADGTATHVDTAFPTLQRVKPDSDSQIWYFVPVSGDEDTYAIVPKRFLGHALSAWHGVPGDNYVAASRAWGGKATFQQYWRLTKPPTTP